jgi:hypothetical protein
MKRGENMGTRAVIRMNGKFMYATHWDGYPDSLGKDLLKGLGAGLTIQQIADSHSIDFTVKDEGLYDDYAEYEYNIKGNQIHYRELEGSYKSTKRGKWKFLGTIKRVPLGRALGTARVFDGRLYALYKVFPTKALARKEAGEYFKVDRGQRHRVVQTSKGWAVYYSHISSGVFGDAPPYKRPPASWWKRKSAVGGVRKRRSRVGKMPLVEASIQRR